MTMKTACAAAAAGLLALSTTSGATVLIKKNLVDLSNEAESIVTGTVTEVWSEPAGGSIDSYAEVQVSEWIKGDSNAATVTVKVPGGTIGDFSVEVPGTPDLRAGQELYLFLHNDTNLPTTVVGWAQGAFHVEDGVVVEVGAPLHAFERRLEAILDSSVNQ